MKQFFNRNSYCKAACYCLQSHYGSVDISAKTFGDGPFRKIRVYLISRFFSFRENRENFMLAKYTWFTVSCCCCCGLWLTDIRDTSVLLWFLVEWIQLDLISTQFIHMAPRIHCHMSPWVSMLSLCVITVCLCLWGGQLWNNCMLALQVYQ